jgi:NTE family protein
LEATTRSTSGVIYTFLLVTLLGAASLSLSGCATVGKSEPSRNDTPVIAASGDSPGKASVGPGQPEQYGPPMPPTLDNPVTVYGPTAVTVRPIVLVLGPGMARGYAYVGAIRALHKAKIPIGAILGTEMGALIGALYSMDGKINQFEWALLKFKDDLFLSPKGLLSSMFQKSNNGKRLESELEHVFNKKDLNQSKYPFRVAIQMKDSGTAAVLERGQAAEAIRAALADPDLFEPGTWNGSAAISAAKIRPLLITEARAMNLGPVVVIDALDEQDDKKYVNSSELKDADLVIHPDLHGIGPTDFQKRTDAAFRGKKAVNAQMAEIKHLVGIP